MNNFQTGHARDNGSSVGRIVVGLVVLALFVGAFLAAFLLSSQPGSPPSLAGLASPSATAHEPSPGGSVPAEESTAPSSSASSSPSPKPTPKPTAKPTPRPTPRPTATPNTSPAISSFQIPSTVDCAGSYDAVQIQITWVVKRATGVTIAIDGPGIYKTYHGTSGLATVPFACGIGDTKHTYTLRTTGGSGPAVRWTKTVKRTN